MTKIYAYGESLLRWDISPWDEIKRFPTGTAFNFLANIAELQNHQCYLLSALSNKKDSKIFENFLINKKIDYQNSYIAQTKNMGSYTIFRTPTIFGWEVIYNRQNSSWIEFLETNQDISLKGASKGDHLHFDGISLLVHPKGYHKINKLIMQARKLQMSISFDFNLRWTLANDNVLKRYKKIIAQIDYLNISSYDINNLLNKRLDEEIDLQELKQNFPNLQAIFGYQKKADNQQMSIAGYLMYDNKLKFSPIFQYKPSDLIGQGDAFCAFMIDSILQRKIPNLDEALSWSIFKTNYLGDANVPTIEEFLFWKKKVNIIR